MNNTNRFVVGFAGLARSGKDTFGKLFIKRVYEKFGQSAMCISFAHKVKADLDKLLLQNLSISAFTNNKASKDIIRPILVAYAEACRQINPLHWVEPIMFQVINCPNVSFAITDVRYENETLEIQKNGGKVIALIRKDIKPPNKSEKKNFPKVCKIADKVIEIPKFDNLEEDILTNQTLIGIVDDIINNYATPNR
jgi:hypothetical protein